MVFTLKNLMYKSNRSRCTTKTAAAPSSCPKWLRSSRRCTPWRGRRHRTGKDCHEQRGEGWIMKKHISVQEHFRGTKLNEKLFSQLFTTGPSIPGLFSFIFVLFKQFYSCKTVDSSRIQTGIIRKDGKRADHLTTTTAANFFKITLKYLPYIDKVPKTFHRIKVLLNLASYIGTWIVCLAKYTIF